MVSRVTVPQPVIEEILPLLAAHPGAPVLCEMGVNRKPNYGLHELLYHGRVSFLSRPRDRLIRRPFVPVLLGMADEGGRASWRAFEKQARAFKSGFGILFIRGGDNIQARHTIRDTSLMNGYGELWMPGAGMERLALRPLSEQSESVALPQWARGFHKSVVENDLTTGDPGWRLSYGRLAGAVGGRDIEVGFEAIGKARRLRVAIVGLGRGGSLLALRLAKAGVGAEATLMLIDVDVVNPENLEGMLIPPQAVGLPKAFVAAAMISALVPGAKPVYFNDGLDGTAVTALHTADVIFSAVDEDHVRLALALIARRYHIVHIDVCGGAAWMENRNVARGGEVRVSIPGTPGCLSCMGNANNAHTDEALRILRLSAEQERQRRSTLRLREERAGSAMEILYPVVGEAIQAFWGILTGDISRSLWWHYEKNPGAKPDWTDWSNPTRWRECRLCSDLAGLGDLNIEGGPSHG